MTAYAQRDPAPVALKVLRRSQHILLCALALVGAFRSPDSAWLCGIFVVWYLLGVLSAHRASRAWMPAGWLLVLCLLWAGLVTLSVDFVWLAFPLFVLCMQVLPLRVGLAAVTALTLAAVLAFWLHRGGPDLAGLLGPVIGAAVAIVITVVYQDLNREAQTSARLLADLTEAQQQLADTARQTGALAERDRLASEIHDTVSQSITSIIMLLRSASNALAQSAASAAHHLNVAEQAAQSALEDTRRLIRALAPAELAGHSLPEALQRLTTDTTDLGQDATFVIDGEPYTLPTAIEVALLRVAQEALANVRTHAAAAKTVVTLTYLPEAVSLDVADDGQGFAPGQPQTSPHGTGIGLAVMRKRIQEAGGNLTVESGPGRGTAVNATVPVGPQR